jgi:signal transduction histidine kinase
MGASIDGAARSAWQPNVLSWMTAWRALITAELLILLGSGITARDAAPSVLATVAWTMVTALALLASMRRHAASSLVAARSALIIDLAACLALLVIAPDAPTRSLLAAYGCSTIIAWASQRPVNAFIAAGACAVTYVVAGALSSGSIADDAVGTIALLLFFALATSGFFTVAHRIGALEIATEITRERGRYRRDLHDRLGQALSGMHFEVQAVHAVGLDADAPSRLTSLADGYHNAQRMLRDLLSIGDEPMVGTNVASVIRQDARRMAQQAGVRIDVETTGDPSRVPAWMRPHVIAVAGECVNNAVKNGEAAGIDVSIDVADDVAVVSVTDDGIGFDNPPGTITEKEGHYGLREMAERARICGGEVVVASQVGFGTRVRLQVPLPDGATQDILERDVSRLRENVWTLVAALRVALGAVAIGQLAWWTTTHHAHRMEAIAITVFMLVDVALVAATSQRLRRRIARSELLVSCYSLCVAGILALSVWHELPPAILVYAPLALLGVGVAAGRRAAYRQTVLLLGAVCLVAIVVSVTSHDAELQALLVHVTDIALMGMAAVQGAKLLDRLETLQIRVRYQALAQLRRGLSGRMREQLTERLQQLERTARALASAGTSADAGSFAQQTERLQTESTELKQRLRDIVHTLAEPSAPPSPPRKAKAHV